MTRQIPSYLRLHRSDARPTGRTAAPSDELALFWQAYTEATGWRLDPRRRVSGPPRLLPSAGEDILSDVDDQQLAPAVPRSAAERLAEAAGRLAARLHDSQAAIRRQEAELAAGLGPLAAPSRQAAFADVLERVLRDAMLGSGSVAAALYLLDNDTSSLKMRASVGLPAGRLAEPSRPLRGALGDLESLVAGVVAIDVLQEPGDAVWNSPEPYAAGLCASVCQNDLPLGTIWLWSDQPRSYGEADKAVARLAASHLAAEIAREHLDRRSETSQLAARTLRAASHWQQRQTPLAMPLAQGWHVDGWCHSPAPLAASWYTWDVLPDGSIAVAAAEAHSSDLDAAMIAATARAAFQSHSNYRHCPRQMLQRVADTLWQSNSGDQLVSLLYARLDPESGEGHVATAGSIHSLIASRYGFRPLTAVSDPLGNHPDLQPKQTELRLLAGESLVACTAGLLVPTGRGVTIEPAPAGRLSQQQLAAAVSTALGEGAAGILPAIRRAVAKERPTAEQTVVVLSRR